MGALEGMAPAGTGAEAAQGALQSRLAAIDQIGDSAAAAASSEAANRAAAITPQMTPEEQGAAASAAVEAQRAPVATALAQASDQARSAADQSMGEFGEPKRLLQKTVPRRCRLMGRRCVTPWPQHLPPSGAT